MEGMQGASVHSPTNDCSSRGKLAAYWVSLSLNLHSQQANTPDISELAQMSLVPLQSGPVLLCGLGGNTSDKRGENPPDQSWLTATTVIVDSTIVQLT